VYGQVTEVQQPEKVAPQEKSAVVMAFANAAVAV
jgi:hypothetical protein